MIADIRHLPARGAEPNTPSIASFIGARVMCRAGVAAVILGSALTLSNQSGAIIDDHPVKILPLVLAYLTPFAVATVSQALGMRQALSDACRGRPTGHSQDVFLMTAMSHGIPFRSLLLGLTFGAMTAIIVTVVTILDGGDIFAVPMAPIGQAFVLPTLFGLISQALSYRRATGAVGQPNLSQTYPASV